MESYQILFDWEGKMEPRSPSSQHSGAEEEYWSLEDDFANENLFQDVMFDIAPEMKPSAIELLQELADEANIEIIDDQWLGQKIKLPPLDDYAPLPAGPIALQPEKVQNTEELLMEFEYIYELTHLTPPQTPPQQQYVQVLPSVNYVNYSQPEQQQQQQIPSWNENFSYENSAAELPTDIARELEVVDELVRSRSKDLPDWTDEDDDDDGENSCSASSETGSTSSSSPRSDSSYCGSAYSQDNDDDWRPKRKSTKSSSLSGVTKKRGRGSEDKKSRKKEQNKNAATRYRQKKKAEIEEILDEERKLIDVHDELKSKSDDIRREVKYLKSLMRELYKAKGML